MLKNYTKNRLLLPFLIPFLLHSFSSFSQDAEVFSNQNEETETNFENWNVTIPLNSGIEKLNKKTHQSESPFHYKNFLAPIPFFAYGITSQLTPSLLQFDRDINDAFTRTGIQRFKADDYLQLTPMVAMLGLDFLGVSARHDILDRTFLSASSVAIMGIAVTSVKYSVGRLRPDGSAHNSFPSGHTALAFVGAHLLFKEYKETSPWIGVGGYTVAAGIATARMANHRHWFSDVVMGAGFGILSVELSYLLLPAFQKMVGKDVGSRFSLLPVSNQGAAGLTLVYSL